MMNLASNPRSRTPRRQARLRPVGAMTLIEIMVAMTILTVVLGVLTFTLSRVQELTQGTRTKTDIYDQARIVFDVMGRDLQGIVAGGSSAANNEIYWSNKSADLQTNCKIAFVSSSGIGTDIDTEDNTVEVGYFYDATAATVVRATTTAEDGSAWDFMGDVPSNWATTWNDSTSATNRWVTIAEGVKSFSIKAYSNTTTELTNTTDTNLPLFYRITVELFDPDVIPTLPVPNNLSNAANDTQINKTLRTFTKSIFVQQGN